MYIYIYTYIYTYIYVYIYIYILMLDVQLVSDIYYTINSFINGRSKFDHTAYPLECIVDVMFQGVRRK